MSTINDAKFILIPSGYKSQKVYSVKPTNGDGDFTFARTGEATRVNPGGNIETIATNVPRMDHFGGGCPSLLLENESTNRLTYSSDFDNFSKVNLTVASDSQTSPSGEFNADTLTRNSPLTSYVTNSFSKPSSTELDMTLSVFVKQNVGDFFAMRGQGNYPNRADIIFQFSTKTFTTSVGGSDFSIDSAKYDDFGNGWFRLSAKFNTDSHSTLACLFSPRSLSGQVDSTDSSSDSSVYLWGAQCELDNLSSFIPTTTAAVTRNAETCTDSGNSNVFNDSEGVLYAEISGFVNGGVGDRTISISDGSQSNSIQLLLHNTANRINFRVRDGGSLEVNISDFTFQQNQINKIACKYKLGDYALWINGEEKATTTSGNLPSNLNEIAFNDGALNDFYGKVKDLRYYDTALTDAELTELTTL